jgi:predicted transcriptional regulator
MKPFCEIIVSKVLPAMRAIVTRELMHTYGLSQTETARRLGVTQPAISQYSRELRGYNVKLLKSSPKVMKEVKGLAAEIASGKTSPRDMPARICEICGSIRKERVICKLHEQNYPPISPCKQCFN